MLNSSTGKTRPVTVNPAIKVLSATLVGGLVVLASTAGSPGPTMASTRAVPSTSSLAPPTPDATDVPAIAKEALSTAQSARHARTLALNTAPDPALQAIKHLVVIVQENHSFDNYWYTYPGVIGGNASVCMPAMHKKPCVRPTLTTDPTVGLNLRHDWAPTRTDWDNGRMDGFVIGEKSQATMSYYDRSTLPAYYSLADHYSLLDQFYSSVRSFSLPNHWYEIAGQAPYLSIAIGVTGKYKSSYLQEANQIPTLADLMVSSNASWKYYDNPLPPAYGRDATDIWNPYLAKQSTFTLPYSSHFVARSQFLRDAATNSLPAVSYVIPNTPLSEHPPNNVQLGQDYVIHMVNAVMQSPAWNSTVIVIFWDDFGGFFDTSAPPQVDQYGYGFRVGALVVSPFVSKGVNHAMLSPESILRFVEQWQGLPSLTARDANATSLSATLDPSILSGTNPPVPPDVQPLSTVQRSQVTTLIPRRSHED